jgi:hypothetical protein
MYRRKTWTDTKNQARKDKGKYETRKHQEIRKK